MKIGVNSNSCFRLGHLSDASSRTKPYKPMSLCFEPCTSGVLKTAWICVVRGWRVAPGTMQASQVHC